ncbi:hypothetical protein Tco_1313253 [Tanacetum coccineum]
MTVVEGWGGGRSRWVDEGVEEKYWVWGSQRRIRTAVSCSIVGCGKSTLRLRSLYSYTTGSSNIGDRGRQRIGVRNGSHGADLGTIAYHPQTKFRVATVSLGVLTDVYQEPHYREPDFVMSDSEDSTVTYTEVSSLFEDLSDIGSPGVYGLPMMLEDPYVKAALQAPPSPDYVPEDDVLPAEEQPLPVAVSPTADLPSYITESNLEEDPEEDDEDHEEDLADYPDDRDDNEEESSGDNADDDEEDKDKDEEEDEHLAPDDSIPPPTCRTTVRMSTRDQTPIPFSPAAEVDRFLTISTPPPSPLTSYSSPLPHIPSPPLPVSSPLPVSPPPLPASPTYPLGYRAAMILAGVFEFMLPPQKRLCIALGLRFKVDESSSTPTARPTGGFRADYGFVSTLDDEIRRDPKREVGYGIIDTWDKMVEDMQGTPAVIDVEGLSEQMTDFVMTVRKDTNEIYERLDDAQDDRSLMSDKLNMLHRDRRAHARTARLMESDAKISHKAWVQSMDASDTARSETISAIEMLWEWRGIANLAFIQLGWVSRVDDRVLQGRGMGAKQGAGWFWYWREKGYTSWAVTERAPQTTVLAQQTEIGELLAADRRRQTQLTEALTLMRTLQT